MVLNFFTKGSNTFTKVRQSKEEKKLSCADHTVFVKIVRVFFIVACPMVFVLLCNQGRQGRVFKLIRKAQL